jgi:hypothetical protein
MSIRTIGDFIDQQFFGHSILRVIPVGFVSANPMKQDENLSTSLAAIQSCLRQQVISVLGLCEILPALWRTCRVADGR